MFLCHIVLTNNRQHFITFVVCYYYFSLRWGPKVLQIGHGLRDVKGQCFQMIVIVCREAWDGRGEPELRVAGEAAPGECPASRRPPTHNYKALKLIHDTIQCDYTTQRGQRRMEMLYLLVLKGGSLPNE